MPDSLNFLLSQDSALRLMSKSSANPPKRAPASSSVLSSQDEGS